MSGISAYVHVCVVRARVCVCVLRFLAGSKEDVDAAGPRSICLQMLFGRRVRASKGGSRYLHERIVQPSGDRVAPKMPVDVAE